MLSSHLIHYQFCVCIMYCIYHAMCVCIVYVYTMLRVCASCTYCIYHAMCVCIMYCIYQAIFVCIVYIHHSCASLLILIWILYKCICHPPFFFLSPPLYQTGSKTPPPLSSISRGFAQDFFPVNREFFLAFCAIASSMGVQVLGSVKRLEAISFFWCFINKM